MKRLVLALAAVVGMSCFGATNTADANFYFGYGYPSYGYGYRNYGYRNYGYRPYYGWNRGYYGGYGYGRGWYSGRGFAYRSPHFGFRYRW